MKMALSLATTAIELDEVPVGAVVVSNKKVIATGYNQREKNTCSTAHAEILAIEKACQALGRWRLSDCWLYVSLEPCIMCAGALWQSRIQGVTFGARDPKGGALTSVMNINAIDRINHHFSVEEGIYADESSDLLKQFFKQKRQKISP